MFLDCEWFENKQIQSDIAYLVNFIMGFNIAKVTNL